MDKQVSSSFLFLLGLMTAPALVLAQELWLKSAQTLLYIGLARLRKQRLFLPGGLIFLAATVLFSLLNPMGRVLFELGGLHVTDGAMRIGLYRGLTVLSLIYLSRFSVRADLRLPGALGMLVARTFFYLHRLLEGRKSLSSAPGGWVVKLDRLLEDACSEREEAPDTPVPVIRTRFGGMLFPAVLLFGNWCFVFMTRWGIF